MRLNKDRVASVVGATYGQRMLEESDRAQAGNPEDQQVWNLLIGEIEPDPDQPRRHFDENALRDLADDINLRGVLQPILVRRLSEVEQKNPDGPVRYRIVFGERRWRASRLAGKPRIPCLIRDLQGSDAREAQLVENVIRQGISDVERGLALRRLYEDMKAAQGSSVTWETIAARVGLSRMRIHHLYSLSLLPLPIIELIQSGRLSGSHGTELARLGDNQEAMIALALEASRPEDAITSGPSAGNGGFRLSVAQVRDRVSAMLAAEAPARSSRPLPAKKMEEQMGELVARFRADLSPEVRDRLRQKAQEFLLLLGDPQAQREGDGNDPRGFVKSTLQTPGR